MVKGLKRLYKVKNTDYDKLNKSTVHGNVFIILMVIVKIHVAFF